MESIADIASPCSLQYKIDHLFLPPKTPQKDDTNPVLENELVASALRSLEAFGEAVSDARPPAVDVCLGMLRRMLSVRAPGTRPDPVCFIASCCRGGSRWCGLAGWRRILHGGKACGKRASV
jgi:hypothetical protein